LISITAIGTLIMPALTVMLHKFQKGDS